MPAKMWKDPGNWSSAKAPDLQSVFGQDVVNMLSNAPFASSVMPVLQKDENTRGDILQDFMSPGVHAILLVVGERLIATPFIERVNLMWMQHIDGWLPVDRDKVLEFIRDEKATAIDYTLGTAEALKIMAQPPQA